MKKLFLLFLLCVPCISLAKDRCTNRDEYTIDKRCYVPDAAKQKTPYNATVALVDGDYIHCTGTLAKWGDVSLSTDQFNSDNSDDVYLFTANHCTDNDEDGNPDQYLQIKTQDGLKTTVRLVSHGGYGVNGDETLDNDWAIYRLTAPINQDNVKHVIADPMASYSGNGFMVVGYGKLKIMSDAEISEFKQKYIDYLTAEGITDIEDKGEDYGFSRGGMKKSRAKVAAFIDDLDIEYWLDLFDDNELKASGCGSVVSNINTDSQCQTWEGNSGGPVFDNRNRLAGIHISGYGIIGGAYHARQGDSVTMGHVFKDRNKNKKEQ